MNVALNLAKQIRRALNPADFYLSAPFRGPATPVSIVNLPAVLRPLLRPNG